MLAVHFPFTCWYPIDVPVASVLSSPASARQLRVDAARNGHRRSGGDRRDVRSPAAGGPGCRPRLPIGVNGMFCGVRARLSLRTGPFAWSARSPG
jgi:hypothetical protein